LDVTSSSRLFGKAENIAEQIRQQVYKETGLTVSAGVASSKLVAKIASDINKPDGLTVIAPGTEAEFLSPLPIKRLWGVGKKIQEALKLLGIKTIGDLAGFSPKLLEQKFGRPGISLHTKAHGLDSRNVETEHETKSVGHEFTFETDLTDIGRIKKELLELSGMVGKRLRRYRLQGKTITLKVKYHDFQLITRSLTMYSATADNKKIFTAAAQLLKKTEAGKRPIRLLGISVSGLIPEKSHGQKFLFPELQTDLKRELINKALDTIHEKYGTTAILPGRMLEGDS
ncbi:MAG: DNA polymerase IV, partial [Deltaproteobacteria bacterium]|nr:DNA polymerase IV [Deltaproteobacteria bacterium]